MRSPSYSAVALSKSSWPFLFAFAAIGCTDVGARGAEAGAVDAALREHRIYAHPLFDDPDDCPDDALFNCEPSLTLCPDGEAVLLVTDIVNPGTYQETAAPIVFTLSGPGDVPSRIEFAIERGGRALVDDWQGWRWTLVDDLDAFDDFCSH